MTKELAAAPSGIRGVLFDLDDTLFDDAACTRSGLSEVARHYGCDWPTEQILARYREIVAALDPQQAARLYRRGYVAAYATCEGALEILAELRVRGLRVGILTNYLRGVLALPVRGTGSSSYDFEK